MCDRSGQWKSGAAGGEFGIYGGTSVIDIRWGLDDVTDGAFDCDARISESSIGS